MNSLWWQTMQRTALGDGGGIGTDLLFGARTSGGASRTHPRPLLLPLHTCQLASMFDPVTPTTPPPAVALPPTSLPTLNLVAMLGWGFVFQALTPSYALAAWASLLPLLVLGRTASLPVAVVGGFVVVVVARAAAVGDVAAAAVIGTATVVVMIVHRFAHRELPRVGAWAAPCAVVVVEYLAMRTGLSVTSLPLSSLQAADVPLFRYVDIVTPLGISFAVAWSQAVLAGFGESFLVADPIPQVVRERGLLFATSVCFVVVVVVGHGVGFFIDDAQGPVHSTIGSGTHVDAVAAVAAVGLVVLLAMAVAARRHRDG